MLSQKIRSKSRSAALLAAGARKGSVAAGPLGSAGWWRTRHHQWKRSSRLSIPRPTKGFTIPMDGAGLPLGWLGPGNSPVTNSSCGVGITHGYTGSSWSKYSHSQHNHHFPAPHLHLHLHVRIQQRVLGQPSCSSPPTAQIWDFQCILVYHLLLSDAELSVLWKLQFNSCVQEPSLDNRAWGECMERAGWKKSVGKLGK